MLRGAQRVSWSRVFLPRCTCMESVRMWFRVERPNSCPAAKEVCLWSVPLHYGLAFPTQEFHPIFHIILRSCPQCWWQKRVLRLTYEGQIVHQVLCRQSWNQPTCPKTGASLRWRTSWYHQIGVSGGIFLNYGEMIVEVRRPHQAQQPGADFSKWICDPQKSSDRSHQTDWQHSLLKNVGSLLTGLRTTKNASMSNAASLNGTWLYGRPLRVGDSGIQEPSSCRLAPVGWEQWFSVCSSNWLVSASSNNRFYFSSTSLLQWKRSPQPNPSIWKTSTVGQELTVGRLPILPFQSEANNRCHLRHF